MRLVVHTASRLVLRYLLVAVAAACVVVVFPTTAAAQGEEAQALRLAVRVEGRGADDLRQIVLGLVPEGVDVVDDKEFSRALTRAGLRGRMGASLSSKRYRRTLLKMVERAMARVDASAAVLARVRGDSLTLLYVDDAAEVLIDETVSIGGDESEQRAELEAVLAEELQVLAPLRPPEPEELEEPPPETPEVEEPEPEEPRFAPHRPGFELFGVSAGMEVGGRFFAYNDGTTDNLLPYDVFGVPAVSVAGEVYPLASLETTFVSDIGLSVAYMHAFGLTSQLEDGSLRFSTTWNRFAAGLRYRFRFDDSERPFVLLLDGSLGFLNFALEPENERGFEVADQLATAGYLFLRAGLEARIPLGQYFALIPSAGYIGALKGGELYNRFREPVVRAIDTGLQLPIVLAKGVEIRLGGRYTHFFGSFGSVPGDRYVAAGATDQYVAIQVLGAYIF